MQYHSNPQSINICCEIMFSLLSSSSYLCSDVSFFSIFLIVIVLFLSSTPFLEVMYDAFFAVLFSIFSRSFSLSSFDLSFYSFDILSFKCSASWKSVLWDCANLALSLSSSMNKPIFSLSELLSLFSRSFTFILRLCFYFSSSFWNSRPRCYLSDLSRSIS